MENVRQIMTWAGWAKADLGLQIEEILWSKPAPFSYFDYVLRLDYGGKPIESRGTDLDQNRAFTIAVSELIERMTLLACGLETSIGVAAHPILSEATERAESEFIEHLLISRLFQEQSAAHFRRSCVTNGYEINLFEAGQLNGRHAIVTLIRALDGECHAAIGTAASRSIEAAENHAIVEAMRKISAIEADIPPVQFNHDPSWRGYLFNLKLAEDPSFFDSVIQNLKKDRSRIEEDLSKPIEISKLSIPPDLKITFPLHVVRAKTHE